MMVTSETLEQSARELVRQVLARTASPHRQVMAAGRLDLDVPRVEWMLPHLVQLVDELHDQPIEQIAPAVRRMLMEQAFVDDTGDAVMTDEERAQIERQIRIIVRILAHARRRARGSRQWSDMPVTPQMFG